ncbi:MAG: DUF362 domain-containing protein [Propionibacteriaceae bacterium]|jgi:uncharacterized Fe-S center protein|nr:DUF362 domain-containing protein [Propionibacteriaceae bacterium]
MSKVYFTKEISAASLLAAFQALGRPLGGKVAIKLHMGEAGNTNYLDPALLSEIIKGIDGAFVDSNTLYHGQRYETEDHLRVAAEHGFTALPVDILDADGDTTLPVSGGKYIKQAIVGSHLLNYDSLLSIAHFKGHAMAGFGGTFKNLGVGVASRAGKLDIHGKGFSLTGEPFIQRVAEYAQAIINSKGDQVAFINILNNLSVSCDCDAGAEPAELDDIGILASLDPVALDRASVDLVYQASHDGSTLTNHIEKLGGIRILGYAEALGLGTQEYTLEEI